MNSSAMTTGVCIVYLRAIQEEIHRLTLKTKETSISAGVIPSTITSESRKVYSLSPWQISLLTTHIKHRKHYFHLSFNAGKNVSEISTSNTYICNIQSGYRCYTSLVDVIAQRLMIIQVK